MRNSVGRGFGFGIGIALARLALAAGALILFVVGMVFLMFVLAMVTNADTPVTLQCQEDAPGASYEAQLVSDGYTKQYIIDTANSETVYLCLPVSSD